MKNDLYDEKINMGSDKNVISHYNKGFIEAMLYEHVNSYETQIEEKKNVDLLSVQIHKNNNKPFINRTTNIMQFTTSLQTQPIKKKTFLINRLIYKNSLALIVGDSKTYKTFVACEIALSVLTCKDSFESEGFYVREEDKGAVLFISTELDTRQRFLDLCTAKKIKIDELNKLYVADLNQIDTFEWNKDKEALERWIEEYKPKLVVLDPLSYIFDGDITSLDEVSIFLKELKKFIVQYDTTFLLIHHNNRDNTSKRANRVSGSAAITRFVESTIYLEREQDDEAQDIFKDESTLDEEIKLINMTKGNYRYGGEGYKYHQLAFKFENDFALVTCERREIENAGEIKNKPIVKQLEEIEDKILKAINKRTLMGEFNTDDVICAIGNSSGQTGSTYKRRIGEAIKILMKKKRIEKASRGYRVIEKYGE